MVVLLQVPAQHNCIALCFVFLIKPALDMNNQKAVCKSAEKLIQSLKAAWLLYCRGQLEVMQLLVCDAPATEEQLTNPLRQRLQEVYRNLTPACYPCKGRPLALLLIAGMFLGQLQKAGRSLPHTIEKIVARMRWFLGLPASRWGIARVPSSGVSGRRAQHVSVRLGWDGAMWVLCGGDLLPRVFHVVGELHHQRLLAGVRERMTTHRPFTSHRSKCETDNHCLVHHIASTPPSFCFCCGHCLRSAHYDPAFCCHIIPRQAVL